MKESTSELFRIWEIENPVLTDRVPELQKCVDKICRCYMNGGKILVCGNGGSASDSEHIVGELMKGFRKKRPLENSKIKNISEIMCDDEKNFIVSNLQEGLPAISLVSHSALITAFLNDVDPKMIFAQQVLGYGKKEDIFLGLSTSGNSQNVLYGAKIAKSLDMEVISMTGSNDSMLSGISDITLRSTQIETYKVQEDHIKFYHLICAAVENEFFEE